MRFFRNIVESSFYKDPNGQTVFFPSGLKKEGLLIPDEQNEKKLKKLLYSIHAYAVILAFAATIVYSIYGIFWIYLILIPQALIGRFGVKKATAFYKKSELIIAPDVQKIRIAKCFNPLLLRVLFAFSLLFVTAGIWMVVSKPEEWALGLVSTVFFGWCAYNYLKLIAHAQNPEIADTSEISQ